MWNKLKKPTSSGFFGWGGGGGSSLKRTPSCNRIEKVVESTAAKRTIFTF